MAQSSTLFGSTRNPDGQPVPPLQWVFAAHGPVFAGELKFFQTKPIFLTRRLA
jgi:hypothetical protein